MCVQWWRWCSLVFLLTSCYQWRCSHAQPATVQLELGSSNPANNTVVLITDVGENDNQLVCTTNRNPCCAHMDNRFGDWYFPNGSAVRRNGDGDSFYRTRRDVGGTVGMTIPGGVLLHRRNDAMSPTGMYYCIIPDANSMDQTLYVGLYTSPSNAAQLESINFELTSGDAMLVMYSLTCTSNGGPISTMQWTRDGATINGANIYPRLTFGETATYTNTLEVSVRQTGMYTCIATDGDTLSLSQSLTVEAANPPTAVMASLNATSGDVLVSLTPPVGGETVTGYRIYYNAGGSQTNELITTTENEFVLDLKGATLDDMMISIRAESDQLPSELVSVNVTTVELPSTTTTEAPTTTEVTTLPPTEGPSITVMVTANLNTPPMVGQTDNSLTCDVSGADNLNAMITYQWTRNTETISDASSSTLTLSSLTLSDAGEYTCNVTVRSAMLTNDIQASSSNVQAVSVQTPDPQLVTVTSSDNIVTSGSSVTVMCTVKLNSAILESELSLLMVMAQLFRDGTSLTLTGPTISGTTFTYDTTVNSFSESDSGNYTCTATVTPLPSSQFITGMGQRESDPLEITIAAVTIEPTEITTGQPIENITAVSITPSGTATATAGESYSLECTVTVTGSDDPPMITWLDNDTEITSTAARMVSGITGSTGSGYSSTLMFSPLRASDAGTFTCRATLGNITNSQVFSVAVQVPDPSVTVSSTSITAGSSVTVICTVELNQYVDVGLTVNIQWTGPENLVISPTDPFMESTNRYTSTITFVSFGRVQSGVYACSATISSDTLMTSGTEIMGMERITVGVYLSLRGTVYANNSVIPITAIGQTDTETMLPPPNSNNGLQCITDRMPCCSTPPNRFGHWQFPNNKTNIGISGTTASFYRNRGDDGTVNLNRVSDDVMMPTGLFCCIVRDVTEVDQTVCANIVSYTIVITRTGTSTAGQTYSLSCSLTEATDTVTYQWLDSNGTQLTNDSQLEFPLLRASDGGLYTCQATVGGVVVEQSATVNVSLPVPITVTVTPPVGLIIAGSSPSLTCTVELDPAVDVPVNVSTEWSSPDMTTVTSTSSVMESLTRYTVMADVNAARGGSYTCQASIDSSSQFITGSGKTSGSITITVASLPAPTLLEATSITPTSITLTWEQPEGADAVNRYEIVYDRIINECGGGMGSFGIVTVTLDDGSLRRYTLTNSSSTPVDEDTMYFIELIAVNSVTRSDATMAFPYPITTADAAPGLVQSLRVGSVDVTNITVLWDRVNCVDRNGHTDSYTVTFFPTSNPNDRNGRTVSGTEDSDRMVSVTGLPPRTNYTFEVEANNPVIRDTGAVATITVSTTAPLDLEFLLSGRLYPNNSLVTLDSSSVLYCLTPSTECCGSSVSGEWYLPGGAAVSSSTTFRRSQVPSAVNLRRRSGTPPTGVYRCEIPDASGTNQNIYVGIYPQGAGSPSIQSVIFDRNSTTLTCTSTDGPPTTVTWSKNNVPVNLSLYEQSQRLVDAESATYESVLFNADVANFVGSFTCEVSNARDTNEVTVELNGITIDRDSFIVGQSATAMCVSDVPATMIEWLNGEIVLMASSATTQQLDLVFSLVNDSIHNQVYVCRVTRLGDGLTATQNFTANVIVPPTAISATVSSSGIATAGMVYNLTCTISKTAGGLINTPTATWTTGEENKEVAITNGNGITVSNMIFNETATSTLTFDLLRTSHNGRYSCDGTLTSPALEAELMHSTVETFFVRISTPHVVMTVPTGTLFAGRIAPLTLTCTISINNATDTDIEISDMDITWLRESTRLSNDDSRVTISSVTGSRPSFTSILVLSPPSTVDNTNFTCRARVRRSIIQQGFISDSEVGVNTDSVIVTLPSAPVVRINPFNGDVTAGGTLRVICSLILQEGIIYNNDTLTTQWTRDGTPLPTGESSGALIFISPVTTSHAGRYTCTARLNIPEAGVDISETNTTSIVVQIPPPTLTIRGYPRDTEFFRGLVFNFTCMIEIDPSVDTGVTVEASWERNGNRLENSNDSRITVINTGLGSAPYRTNISFNATDFEDAGTYNCTARIIPLMPEFILEATGFVTRTITVLNFPPQVVTVTDEGVSTSGYTGYTLICTANREADLNPASTLTVQWLDSEGNITNGDDFSISGTQGPSSDVSITSRLTFNNILLTSQAGLYTCRTLLTIPGTVIDHQVENNFTVTVKLPAPEIIAISESRGGPIYEGTMFSVTCLITPNMTGVNTDITIQRTFSGPDTSAADRVMTENDAFQTTLMFHPVAMTNDGRYVCSASAISTSQYPNVEASNETENNTVITISSLPAPTVTITAPPTPTGGQSYTLDCSARTEDYVISVPSVEWVNIDNSDRNIIQPPQTNGTVSANRSLTFNQIRTSHGGRYTCRASINIPIASITDRSNTAMEDVRVQIPTSVVIVSEGSFPAYNGTVYNLTGMLQLDTSIVDTDITVIWEWSLNGQVSVRMNTSAAPHMITIPFIPLATNDSGLYSMNLNQQPTNPQYVVGNNNSSTVYNLIVLSLPLPVPSIAITARSDDRCSQAMTFTCSATTVDNLYRPPCIEWRYDGSAVSDNGNPQMNSTAGQLIFSSITSENSGDYTCRAIITIPESGIDDHYNETRTTINTQIPAKVLNLQCRGNPDDTSLSISWEEPMAQGTTVVGYSVECRRVNQLPSRELETVPLNPAYDEGVDETLAQVTQGLNPEIPYDVTVKALNLAGCGQEQQIYCFTQEGEPPMPQNVTVTRINDTAMIVSWHKFTLVELKGFAMYIITYTVSGGSRKRQNNQMATAMWFENNKTIGGLSPRLAVNVQVHTNSSGGRSNIAMRMLEAVPTDSPASVAPIIGAIIAVILIIVVIIIAAIIIVILVRRHRISKKYSTRDMYNVSSKSDEIPTLQLQPLDNGDSQPAISDKDKEALEESAIVPPPTAPRSAITTEVLDRMKPVSQASFRDHVAEKHEDRDKGFEAEYQSFGTDPVNSHEIAKLPINRPKNRFANIFPYDHSRVKLNTLPGEEGSDYINACSLDGYKREGCYIAAQGPMPNTISDFWRMIWEKRLPNIVMLTKCLEAGRRKCEQYWADNIGEDYQTPDKKLNITTTSVMPYADFSIRTFSVKSLTDASLDPLSVTQYHFTSWPDHGVPKFATSLISFIRRVQRGHTKDSGRQLLVHCSAGVGRTGTLITLDSMLDRMAAKEPDVNVYEFVFNMRQRRVLMVQTLAQYVFIHDALNELITCGQTDIVASALRTKVNFLSKVIPAKGITGFQNQFQLLEQVSRLPADEDLTDAMEHYNQSKNRYPDKIPYNMSRARLRPTGEDGSEYINASFIDGYKQRNAYIATQGPLQNTVNDVWRMLYEFKSRTLVMLCNMNEDGGEASYPFFPSKEEEPVKYGKMLVTLQSKASYTDFIVRKFSIQEDKQGSPKNDGFVVTQFHLTEWPPRQVPNTGTLIEMLDMVTKNQMSTGNRPITVMCNDGVGRTGTFICIHAQLERLKTEGVVDFFQSIKSARIQRAGLVPDVDQYAFCHTVLADYIDKFDNYANFKDMIM